eukprot:scaffold5380_cov131-Cylindrotheca_fusiformis.AAC.28
MSVSSSGGSANEEGFQNEPPVSPAPSTSNSTKALIDQNASLRTMFTGLNNVEKQYNQFLRSDEFRSIDQSTRSFESNSNYDSTSLREELDGARLASPSSTTAKPKATRPRSPIKVETVLDEDSCHPSSSIAEESELYPLYPPPPPATAPPSPPPSSASSSATTEPSSNQTNSAAAAADYYRNTLLGGPRYSDSGEGDYPSSSFDDEGIQLDHHQTSDRERTSSFSPITNKSNRSYRNSWQREGSASGRSGGDVEEGDEPSIGPLEGYYRQQQPNQKVVIAPEDEEAARKDAMLVAGLVACICLWLIWIFAMVIVLITRA